MTTTADPDAPRPGGARSIVPVQASGLELAAAVLGGTAGGEQVAAFAPTFVPPPTAAGAELLPSRAAAPAPAEPVTPEPAATEPAIPELVTSEPVTSEPATTGPEVLAAPAPQQRGFFARLLARLFGRG
ncbi:hypothetical protein [Kineococcus glutinatus]|uniref:Uncharacterized protein n=1 Tax=Kineococcus glutinatus TaxID=1070872 RepID=A0ABP9H863_9ACTN